MRNLKNKKIIITGASSGIGEKLAWRIAKKGGIPILIARSEEKLAELTAQIATKYKHKVFYYAADITDSEKLRKTVSEILSEHERIDGLINNAGMGKFQYAWEVDQEEAVDMFRINVFAVMEITRLLLPAFMAQGYGHIVIVASQAGKVATPKSSVYAASKHAVLGYANALRLEVQQKGILVTTVNPGPVETDFFTIADPEGNYKEKVRHYMLQPDKIAEKMTGSLFKRKREINLPVWMEVGSRIYYLLPGIMERVLKKQFSKK